MALSGCTSLGALSATDALRKLLTLSSQNAFAKLAAPGGFWDSTVARIELPALFTNSTGLMKTLMLSDAFRGQLQHQLNIIAEKGAEKAAPVVLDTVKSISITDATNILQGGPTAATSWLRGQMGPALINAMIPGLSDAIRTSSDPILGKAVSALTGVDAGGVAQSIANRADNAIWYQIGAEESAIRAHPETTQDPLLIGALKIL
ncbi:MAG: DUF4197 domain-containing protein [Proteobacteria bacterium]|nr:DUF4197 domain-containing protein [Pseudomonadota bacterium]